MKRALFLALALLSACGAKTPPLTGILGAEDAAAWKELGFSPVFRDEAAASAAGLKLIHWTCEPDKAPNDLFRALDRQPAAWMALGLTSWTETPGALGPTKVAVFPSRKELRLAAYLALIGGAKGVLFSGVERGDDKLIDYPEQWQALASVARELNALAPALAAPWERIEAGSLAAARWRAARPYLVAANPTKSTACLPDALTAADWRPLFEPRRELERPLCLAPRQALVLEGPRWEAGH